MLVALELDMSKLKMELKQSSDGKLYRPINVNADLADWCKDLIDAGEADTIAQLVDPILRGPLESMHKARGKKIEQLRKLKNELRAARRDSPQ